MTPRWRSVPLLVALVLAAWSLAPGRHLAAAEAKATPLYLVGMGPGDPDLITVRALEVVKRAQIVYCSPGIREKFATLLEGKEVVEGFWRLFPYYGKDPSTLDGQERAEAEQLAAQRKDFIARVRQAVAAGKTVAILDHGDPLIYGPWEWCLEEFEDLHPVVVPGLSAFNAANAAIGKGVTTSQRTKAVILTSTDWPGKTDTIEKLAAHRSTMVLFTMRAEFDDFLRKLSTAYPPETPIAVVQYAGYQGKQRVLRGTLGTIRAQVGQEPLPFEYLIYVGDFLSHRYKKP